MSDPILAAAIREAAIDIAKGLESIASAPAYDSPDRMVTERGNREVNITDAVCEIGYQLEQLAIGLHRIADVYEQSRRDAEADRRAASSVRSS